jgi:hypothetical protein
MIPELLSKIKGRLLSKVNPNPIKKGCWEIMCRLDKHGYGVIGVGKFKKYLAHRLSYEVFVGEIPKDIFVCHTCDNPRCINPDHLFLGTAYDNAQDAKNKGRLYTTYGERSGLHKLTTEQVKAIREDSRMGTVIAKEYGVCKSTICMIKNRTSRYHE